MRYKQTQEYSHSLSIELENGTSSNSAGEEIIRELCEQLEKKLRDWYKSRETISPLQYIVALLNKDKASL